MSKPRFKPIIMSFSRSIRSTKEYSIINLGHVKLPQSPDAVCRQPLPVDPAIDRITLDAQMLGNLIHGKPWLGDHENTPLT